MFRCKDAKNCNKVTPLSEMGDKMWATWELLPYDFGKQDIYIEPTEKELFAKINAVPLKEGYTVVMGPIIIPLNMSQVYDAFYADDAPFGKKEQLKPNGINVMTETTWKDVPKSAPKD